MRHLVTPFEAGDKTCYLNGEPCKNVRTTHFGQRWFCALFRPTDQLRDENGVQSGMGFLQRWPECLEAEKLELETNSLQEKLKKAEALLREARSGPPGYTCTCATCLSIDAYFDDIEEKKRP